MATIKKKIVKKKVTKKTASKKEESKTDWKKSPNDLWFDGGSRTGIYKYDGKKIDIKNEDTLENYELLLMQIWNQKRKRKISSYCLNILPNVQNMYLVMLAASDR